MAAAGNSILKSTGIMTMATLLSRATGLLRTWAMAFALGNTLITSAYQVANNMPNLIYDLVAGGILGAAFLPVYLLQKEKKGRAESDRFASNILNLLVIVLGVIALLATVFASSVITTQTFTRADDALIHEMAVFFFRIFAVQLVFYGIGGVITGVLNANRIYGLPALAPALNNVVVIASMFAYVPLSAINQELALVVVAVGTTLGVLVQFAIQIPSLVKMGFKYTPRISLRDPALKEALRIAVPTLIYIVGTLVSFSCRNAFSLESGDYGPSTILYAWTWYQLPYGVVAVSLSTAFLTEMSDAVARGDFAQLRDFIRRGLRSTLFLIIPLAGMMFVLASPIIQLFRAGAFSQDDVAFVSSILAYWIVSLPFYAGLMYFYRVFAALRQFMTFALVSCGLCVVQIALYAYLCNPSVLGLVGIPVSDFVYYGLMFFIMAGILRARVGSYGMARIFGMCAKVLVSTLVGMALAYAILFFVPLQPSILTGLVQIVVCGGLGLAATFGMARLLRVPEMQLAGSIFGKLFGRLARKHPEDGEQPPTRQLPAGRHVRPGSWEALDDLDDDAPWEKVGKHAAPDGRAASAAEPAKGAADPSSTAAIRARSKHGR